MDGVVVDIPDEGVAPGVLGIHAALVDLNPGIRGAEVLVLHDAGQQLIRIGILRRAALAHVDAAGSHVEEVVDHAGADKEVPALVVIAAPGIAGAIGEDFEFPGRLLALLGGAATTDPGIELEAVLLRHARAAHLAIGEDAVRHIEPSIGSPGEGVHQLMRVLATKAGEDHAPFVGLVIVVAVLEMQEVWLLADVDAVVAADDGTGEIETLDKDGALVGLAIVIGVFEDHNSVLRDAGGSIFDAG